MMDFDTARIAVPLLDVIVLSGFASDRRLAAVREYILSPECGIPPEERSYVVAILDALEGIRTCLDDGDPHPLITGGGRL